MRHGKNYLRRWIGVFSLVAVVSVAAIEAKGVKEPMGSPGQPRADVVTIDTLAQFGPLDEPKVVFLHDKHTAALEKTKEWSGKSCTACHKQEKDGSTSLKFMRLADTSRDEGKNVYHQNCIKCHTDRAAAGLDTGPTDVQCRQCHSAVQPAATSWQPINVNKALHYRHAEAYAKSDSKCGACHHVYDKAARKTVAAVKEEDVTGACAYCHKDKTVNTPDGNPAMVRSLRLAAHGECVSCHRTNAAANKAAGPDTCAGCHSPEGQAKIAEHNAKAVANVSDLRIQRKQPDVILMRASDKPEVAEAGQAAAAPLTMSPVPFNHKAHEAKSESCMACHHESLVSCAKDCHTVRGAKEGQWVTLSKAMHDPADPKSCVGCHAASQKRPECAGCHGMMKKGLGSDQAACKSCHMKPLADQPVQPGNKAADTTAAARLLQSKQPVPLVKVEDIPETVNIKELTNEYEQSEFPHRKVVLAMAEKIQKDPMAAAFHTDPTTLCQGCHHNSPASVRPPKCGNCHGQTVDALNPTKPALKAAFHTQCMGCHSRMGIEGKVVTTGAKPVPTNVDCQGCHKEKKK